MSTAYSKEGVYSHLSPGFQFSGSLPWSSHLQQRTGRRRAWESPSPPCRLPGGGRQPLRQGQDKLQPDRRVIFSMCGIILVTAWKALFCCFTLYMFVVKLVGN